MFNRVGASGYTAIQSILLNILPIKYSYVFVDSFRELI